MTLKNQHVELSPIIANNSGDINTCTCDDDKKNDDKKNDN